MHSVRTRLDIFQAIRYMCIIHQVAKIRISIHSNMSQCDDLQVFEFITQQLLGQHLLNETEKKTRRNRFYLTSFEKC